jgi:predicted NBD/HSP70 family sugar kinase
MISVGIDVSKEKSTVCILKPYGEILSSPFEILHTESDLSELVTMLQRFDEEVRVVMEATGSYHLPILSHQKKMIFMYR